MSYRILIDDNTLDLEKKVNKLMKEGWEPTGGPMLLPSGNLAQAVINKLMKEGWEPTGGPMLLPSGNLAQAVIKMLDFKTFSA